MIATGTGAVIVILVSIVLIPKYSAYGAAFALICGEIFTLLLMSKLFREKLYRSVFFKTYLVKILLASTVMGLIIISLNFSMVWRIFIGILVYGFMLLTMGIVSKETLSKFIKT
jgi:O-antigen/teichoic acid export membrane protein